MRGSWQKLLAGNVSCRLPTQIIFFPESFGSSLPCLQIALIIGCFHGDTEFKPWSSLLTSYKMKVCYKQNGLWGVTAIRIKSTTLFCTMLILQPSVVHSPRNNPPWWASTMTSSWNALLNKGLWIQIYASI